MNDRTELRRLLEAASPVPWSAPRPSRSYAPYKVMDGRGYDRSYDLAYTVEDTLGDNAEFIVAAVNALPGLLDQLDAVEAALARVRALADRIDRHTEVEPDPAMFRDPDTGVWWEVSDAIRAALAEDLAQPTTEGVTHERLPVL